MECAYIGCSRTASQVIDANDGTKNKYSACDLHAVELVFPAHAGVIPHQQVGLIDSRQVSQRSRQSTG